MTSSYLQREIPSQTMHSQVSEKNMKAGRASFNFKVRSGRMKKAMAMPVAVNR
jgi:hypothetical protein